jgi:adenylate cyclase
MQTLAEFQSRVVPLVLRNGGSIDKFMGDGILCHFGAAVRLESACANGLRCAEQIRRSMIEWSGERDRQEGVTSFEFGIGIASGRLVFGAVGDPDRLEFTVIGRPVNTSAKLEKHTKSIPAHILVPYRELQAAVRTGYVPTVEFKRTRNRVVPGISEPMDLAAVLRE